MEALLQPTRTYEMRQGGLFQQGAVDVRPELGFPPACAQPAGQDYPAQAYGGEEGLAQKLVRFLGEPERARAFHLLLGAGFLSKGGWMAWHG